MKQIEEVTHDIIGCAYQVYNEMGFGFLESVYGKSLLIELSNKGLKVEAEKALQVRYKSHIVGNFIADLLVEDKIIVELKSVKGLIPKFEAQLVNYLAATNIETGLLINFGETGVEVKRKFKKTKAVSFATKAM